MQFYIAIKKFLTQNTKNQLYFYILAQFVNLSWTFYYIYKKNEIGNDLTYYTETTKQSWEKLKSQLNGEIPCLDQKT